MSNSKAVSSNPLAAKKPEAAESPRPEVKLWDDVSSVLGRADEDDEEWAPLTIRRKSATLSSDSSFIRVPSPTRHSESAVTNTAYQEKIHMTVNAVSSQLGSALSSLWEGSSPDLFSKSVAQPQPVTKKEEGENPPLTAVDPIVGYPGEKEVAAVPCSLDISFLYPFTKKCPMCQTIFKKTPKRRVMGHLHVSNYALRFSPGQTCPACLSADPHRESNHLGLLEVPLYNLAEAKLGDFPSNNEGHSIILSFKVPRPAWRLDRLFEETHKRVLQLLDTSSLFPLPADGWQWDPQQSLEAEYLRMGLEASPTFKIHRKINANYGLCESYPSVLVFPTQLSEANLHNVAKFRKSNRIPALTWSSTKQKGSLWRSAQPLYGLSGDRSLVDEDFLGSLASPEKPLLIVDLRDKKSAWFNRAAGGGYEQEKHYGGFSELIFANVPNIHYCRDAYAETCRTVLTAQLEGRKSFIYAGTRWASYTALCLKAARRIVQEVGMFGRNVLIHCSDGWDRTAQVGSLAMLCLDPYYRTIEGFCRLVSKEFMSFGHCFRTRVGSMSSGFCPVFLHFLEAAFQLWHLFPNEFEFTPKLLLYFGLGTFAGRFGEFLCNSEKEARDRGLPGRTASIFDQVNEQPNTLYTGGSQEILVLPESFQLRIWSALWFNTAYKDDELSASVVQFEEATGILSTSLEKVLVDRLGSSW